MPTDEDIIQADLGLLFRELHSLGYHIENTQYDVYNFGNYLVVFIGPCPFDLVRDRGQYIVQADKDELVNAGLWRTFNSVSELHPKLIEWLTACITRM